MTRLPAVPVFLGLEAVGSFAFVVTFTMTNLYYVTEVGMSPLQLVLCGTSMELAIFLFEVPTGIVADTVSRRLSVIVSYVILGVATILFGVLSSAPLIIAAYALWGFGYTFQSGAYEAWLADEVGADRLTRLLLRGSQVGSAGSLLGVVASTVIGSIDLRAAIVTGGAMLLVIAAVLAVTMPETGFQPGRTDEEAGPRQLLVTARRGGRLVRGHHLLLLMLAIAFLYGMWTESIDRLWQAQLVTGVGLPATPDWSDAVWIGVITGATTVVAMVAGQVAVTRLGGVSRERLARILLGLNAALVPAALVFAVAVGPGLAITAFLAVSACRALIGPLQSAWVNRTIEDSSVRATVLSIVNQADAVGQVTGGPAIGALGSSVGLRPALAFGAVALTPALALYGRVVRRHGVDPELATLAAEGEA
jgi:MFS transporter, DHA3 family, tetracycline resistance protein